MNVPQMFRVLLVEDSEVDAALAQDELSREPQFVVAHVERLEEAISELKNVHTDAVVLDLGLPDSDGVETLTKLRHDAPHVPVIVLTSTPGEQCELQSAREGAEGYLVKGHTVEGQLRRAVRFTVEREGAQSTEARLAADANLVNGEGKAGEIAHTLNNLLTVMIGQTEIAVNKLPEGSPVREDLSEVLIAAERATLLTGQLLQLRRA
jgi:DNA-binding response OmpR family regulator